MVQQISCAQLAQLRIGEEIELIDVRTPAEFSEVHAEGARNVPLESLDAEAYLKNRSGESPSRLYVICRSGARGQKACEAFIKSGCDNVVNVEGGTLAWEQAGLPVRKSGQKVMSLERQVRISAGFIVLVGALLGIFVNPYFAGISAFVGAGLMFAGITDTCGMAMVLAKMPWNQRAGASCQV